MARRRFFVDQVRSGKAEITGENAHHLTRVLRVETGQKFEITDHRRVWLAEVDAARKNLVQFAVVEELEAGPEPPQIALYLALIKFDRFEWAVEKATELGVARIVPFEAVRSDRGLYDGAQKRVERWRRIAHEASEQSRRLRAPVIDNPIRMPEAIAASWDRKVWLDERPGAAPLAQVLQASGNGAQLSTASTGVITGPEGGWSDGEREQFAVAGWAAASLGPLVLRAETAVCAALAVVVQTWLAGTISIG